MSALKVLYKMCNGGCVNFGLMNFLEVVFVSKPVEHGRFVYPCWFIMQYGVVGGVGLVAEISDDTMFLRVAMNVGDQIVKVSIVADGDSSKWIFKQASGTAVFFIHRFSIGITQITKRLAWCWHSPRQDPWGFGNPKGLFLLFLIYLFNFCNRFYVD